MPPKRSGLVPRTTRDGRAVNCKGETIGMSERVRIGGAPGFPPDEPRVESGVVQFGDDWPGVFIRGDHALDFAHHLRYMLAKIDVEQDRLSMSVLADLLSDLEACDVRKKSKPLKVRRG